MPDFRGSDIGVVLSVFEDLGSKKAEVKFGDGSTAIISVGSEDGEVFVKNGHAYPNNLCQECLNPKFRNKEEDKLYCPVHDNV